MEVRPSDPARHLLRERPRTTLLVEATKPTHHQLDHHVSARNADIIELTRVAAVNRRRVLAATATYRRQGPRPCHQLDHPGETVETLDHQTRQMREQPLNTTAGTPAP